MLGLYIVTTLLSGGIYYLAERAYNARLERKEYAYVNSDSPYEKALNLLELSLKVITPGYNIYSAIKIAWKGGIYLDERENKDLARGLLYRTDSDKYSKKHDESLELENQDLTKELVDSKYQEMTKEEKLAFLNRERELLLSEIKEEKPIEYMKK